MTATVETVSEQLDLPSILPTEKVTTFLTKATTVTGSDLGKQYIFFLFKPINKIMFSLLVAKHFIPGL